MIVEVSQRPLQDEMEIHSRRGVNFQSRHYFQASSMTSCAQVWRPNSATGQSKKSSIRAGVNLNFSLAIIE